MRCSGSLRHCLAILPGLSRLSRVREMREMVLSLCPVLRYVYYTSKYTYYCMCLQGSCAPDWPSGGRSAASTMYIHVEAPAGPGPPAAESQTSRNSVNLRLSDSAISRCLQTDALGVSWRHIGARPRTAPVVSSSLLVGSTLCDSVRRCPLDPAEFIEMYMYVCQSVKRSGRTSERSA